MRVFYNCTTMPLAYDFLAVLLQAEMRRVLSGDLEPLRVRWYWGRNPMNVLPTLDQARCFHGLTRPLLQLIGAQEDTGNPGECSNIGEGNEYLSYAPIVEAFKRGEPLPKLVVPPQYVEAIDGLIKEQFGRPPVTITLREAEHFPFRNSNLPEWLKLADWLTARGERVMFIRDSAKVGCVLPGYTVCHDATQNVLVRAAFYRAAKCNLFVSNGPAMIPLFMDCPWMMFNVLFDHPDFDAGTWKTATGLEPGAQWPWAKPNQRIVWSHDHFEPMRDAWLEYIEPQREAA